MKVCSFVFTVDNLLKEANVGHNGIVKYEDLVHSITQPIAD